MQLFNIGDVMLLKDYRDIVSGALMMLIGLSASWFAYQHYEIGQLNRMGPGFFPVFLGLLLTVIGFFIALPAFFRPGSPLKVELKTLLLVALSITIFAFTLRSMGILFATAAAVLISSSADHEMSWKGRLGTALGVAAMVWIVFIYGLDMVLRTWPWSP
jgi:hypothetical protein